MQPPTLTNETFQPAVLALVALFCAGCTTMPRYSIGVERTGFVTPGRYCLVPESTPSAAQPEYAQTLGCVRLALARHGFSEVSDPAAADMQVLFRYGASFDRTEVQTWTAVQSTDVPELPGTNRSGRTVSPAMPVENRVAHYNAWLIIGARTGPPDNYRDVWTVQARADATPDDTDVILPCLVAAAQSLLAPGAAATAAINLKTSDAAVQALLPRHR